MNVLRFSLAIAVCSFACAASVRAEDEADPREELSTAIPEAIRLLKEKEYETFLKKFVHPDDFKQITKKTPLPEFAAEFGERNAPRLLEVLESIKDNKPKLEADGTKAVYVLKEPVGAKKDIAFVKVDKFWYVQN